MTANLKYLNDCYMEDEIYYHFMLHGDSKISYERKNIVIKIVLVDMSI